MRSIAIDDEKKALEVISIYANKIPGLDLVNTFSNPIEASQFLASNPVDLLFLDINMPGLNGFDLLDSLASPPLVIFTTAYSEYAVQSYQVDALDYLVKPISFSRFLKAVNKAKEQLSVVQQIDRNSPLLLKSGSILHRLPLDEILYLEAEGNYIRYVTQQEKILVHSTMKQALVTLGPTFLQIHRSYIVAIDKVNAVEPFQLNIAGQVLPIGVSFRKKVLQALQYQ